MESFATAYPVIFFDGEQDYDKGHVGVHSVLTFKRFQALMSQKTGIPPNQLSTVFVCRRTLKVTEKRQKLPINENTNFNIILNQHNPSREKDCYFLVSMKKSKKERKGRGKRATEAEVAEEYESGSSRGDISPSDERPAIDYELQAQSENPPISGRAMPGQKAVSGAHHAGKGVSAFRGKPEKTLLRRDAAGVNNFTNGRARFPVARQAEGMGFNMPVMAADNSGFLRDEDWRGLENRRWLQDETTLVGRQYNNPNSNNNNNNNTNNTAGQGSQIPAFYPQMTGRGLYLQDNGLPNGLGLYGKSDFSVVSTNPAGFPSHASLQRVPRGLGALNLQHMQNQILNLNLQKQQSYMMSRAFASGLQEVLNTASGQGYMANNSTVCELCCVAKERPVPFHCCVYDAITSGFRGPSPAGPIERPVKRHIEAAA